MAKVARSSTSLRNKNKLVFHREDVCFQKQAGYRDSKSTCGIYGNIEYTLRINGQFSQSGIIRSADGIRVLIPGGVKAELEVFGSKYLLSPIMHLHPWDSMLGIQQRLRLLAYLRREPSEQWDDALERALLNFQLDHGLSVSGTLCKNTLEKLSEQTKHGAIKQ